MQIGRMLNFLRRRPIDKLFATSPGPVTNVEELLPLCPCCGGPGEGLKPFETTKNIDHDTIHILICTTCTALINKEEWIIPPDVADARNKQGSIEYYDQQFKAYEQEIASCRGLVNTVLMECSPNLPETLLDFGFGSGCFLLSAASIFRHVYGVDINHVTIEAIMKRLSPPPNNVYLYHNIDAVESNVDVVFCWHVLEHLPNAAVIVRSLARVVQPGGAFMFQVPLYRPAYLCYTHITFYNEHSISHLFTGDLWEPPRVEFDVDNGFLTGVVRRRGKAYQV